MPTDRGTQMGWRPFLLGDDSDICLTPDHPSPFKEMSMNELTTVTQRDKWEAEAEKNKEEALAIAEEFKRNPDVNPFLEGNKNEWS